LKFEKGASYIFTVEYDLEGFLECASEEGFDFVQLGYEAPLKWVGNITKDRRKRILDFAKRLGLKLYVHSVANGVNVASTNSGIRKESLNQIKEAIEFTYDVGSDLLTIHPGWKDLYGHRYPDEAYALAVEGHCELAKFAADYGVRIGIENMPAFWLAFCVNPGEAQAMIQAVNQENTGLTLDVGHANLLGAEAIEEFITTINDKIFLIHIHDNEGKRDQHLVIGEGTIDFPQLFSLLMQGNIKVPCSLESHSWKDLVKSKQNLERFLLELK
jgi:sugar phosphate isomerase/epimerase